MIFVKAGVTPKNLIIAAAAANVGANITRDIVITSGTDGTHMQGSKHYTGDALDFRLLGQFTPVFMDRLRERLGPDYQIILESDHVHCEYDPKARGLSAEDVAAKQRDINATVRAKAVLDK